MGAARPEIARPSIPFRAATRDQSDLSDRGAAGAKRAALWSNQCRPPRAFALLCFQVPTAKRGVRAVLTRVACWSVDRSIDRDHAETGLFDEITAAAHQARSPGAMRAAGGWGRGSGSEGRSGPKGCHLARWLRVVHPTPVDAEVHAGSAGLAGPGSEGGGGPALRNITAWGGSPSLDPALTVDYEVLAGPAERCWKDVVQINTQRTAGQDIARYLGGDPIKR